MSDQKDLLGQLEKNDVTIGKDAAKKMKEEIMAANSGKQWLGLGVHEVFIQTVELTQAKTGTMGIKFGVENEEGQGEVTMWLSEGALPYTIKNVSALVVHSVDDDKKKDNAKKFMANVVSAKGLFNVASDKLGQAQCWLSVRESKSGNTYTDKNGEEKPSLDRNLLSYAPKATQVQEVATTIGGAIVTDKDTLEDLPF